MAIAIQTVSVQRFSLNGIQYFKNYLSRVNGNYITIYNAYDSRDELVSNTLYTDVILNGVTYVSVASLQQAILTVIFNRATLGVGNGISSVTGAIVNNTDPLNPVVNTPTKAQIGLGNVDNTSDANKPISTATQTALNGKEDVSNKSISIPTDGTSNTKYPSAKAVKDYVDANGSITPDATSTVKGKVKLAGDLGGTADLPTVPALATKEPLISLGAITQYFRGDKTWQTLNKNAVGLANVDNTSDANKPISTATQTALNLKENSANKATTMTGNTTSNVFFLTAKAIYDWAVALFQPLLVSGTNIKTINGNSVLGAGNLVISGGGGSQNLQQVTDIGNQTTNPIFLRQSRFESNENRGVVMSCDGSAVGQEAIDETFIGCFDHVVGKFIATRYSKRRVEIKPGTEEILLSIKCGVYDSLDFQCVIHNMSINQKIHAKGSGTFNIGDEEMRYKIEYDNCTGVEEESHFRTFLRFRWDIPNGIVHLMCSNYTADNDIYVNINANFL